MKKQKIAGLVPAFKVGGMALAFLMLIGMAACGGKEEVAKSLKPETTKIEGNLGQRFEIVEDEYPVSDYSSSFEFNVKCIEEYQGEGGYIDKIGFGYEILDKDGKILESKEAVPEDVWPGMSTSFVGLKEGEVGPLSIHIAGWPESLRGAKTFRLTIVSVESEGDMESENVVAEKAGSEDWDKILDEYEAYCNKVVALAKKAQAGDVSVMTEYASLLESAELLQKKLENAGPNLSAAQAARLNKIAAKMAKAMM